MDRNQGLRGPYHNRQETEGNMKAAFLKLLREKDINDITISDITRKAHVDRTTFYHHFLGIDDLVASLTKKMIWRTRNVILQNGKSAITAFPHVVWWLATELAETPCREIIQSKYWSKMCETIEESYLIFCSADKRLLKNPEMTSRIMAKAQFLLGGTLSSLAAMIGERFQGEEEDLIATLMEEAMRLEQDVQKLCE